MPTFEFTAPDGRVYEIEGPEGATQSEAWRVLQRRLTPVPEQLPTGPESVQEELAERSVPEQALAGVGASAAETYYGTKELLRRPGAEALSEAVGEPVSALSLEDQRRLEEWRAIRGGPATAGRVVGEMAQVGLPAARAYQAARVGGPLVRATAPITAESGVVGAYEGLKPPEPGETRLGRVGGAAALNLGLGAGMNVLGRAVLPRGYPKSQAALREEEMLRGVGVKPRLPMTLAAEPGGPVGRSLMWAQRYPLMSLPGTSAVLRKQISRSLDDWREAMFLQAVPERARGEIRLPRQFSGVENPAQKTLENIGDWYSREYKRVLDPYNFRVRVQDPRKAKGTLTFTGGIQDALNSIPTKVARNKVRQELNQIFKGQTNNRGIMSGEAVSAVKTAIRNRRIASKKKPDIADGWRRASEAFEDEVERQLKMQDMSAAVDYASLRAPYRNLVALEETSGRLKAKFAEFSPDDLYAATIAKSKRESGRRPVAYGQAPFQQEAQRGARDVYTIDPTKRQEGSVFQVAALGGLTGIGGMASPVTTGAIWAGMLGTLPYPIQRYLMQGYPAQQSLRQLQRSPVLQRALSTGRAGTTAGVYD